MNELPRWAFVMAMATAALAGLASVDNAFEGKPLSIAVLAITPLLFLWALAQLLISARKRDRPGANKEDRPPR